MPERQGARREAIQEPFLNRVGKASIDLVAAAGDILGFIGEAVLALGKLLRGQARFRPVELLLLIQECGAQALPIVTLICFLDDVSGSYRLQVVRVRHDSMRVARQER